MNRFWVFSVLGPVIGESHIYTLPKINQHYKQDRNIPNFQKIENIPFEKNITTLLINAESDENGFKES